MDYILPSSTHDLKRLFRLTATWRTRSSGINELPRPRQISPPTRGSSEDEYWSYIDFRGDVYRLFWSGSYRCPNLAGFPAGCNFEQIKLSDEATHTWKHSALLAHGADSCIREDSNPLPIIKLAHPDPIARQRLEHEFEILQSMSKIPSLPIPRVCPQPFVDSNGIYGYRMERLYQLDFEQLPQYYEAVKEAMQKVHNAGFAIGDLHPGNTMLNEKGELMLIDLAHAGKIGEKIPLCVPEESYELPVFHTEPDTQRLDQFFFGAHSGHGFE